MWRMLPIVFLCCQWSANYAFIVQMRNVDQRYWVPVFSTLMKPRRLNGNVRNKYLRQEATRNVEIKESKKKTNFTVISISYLCYGNVRVGGWGGGWRGGGSTMIPKEWNTEECNNLPPSLGEDSVSQVGGREKIEKDIIKWDSSHYVLCTLSSRKCAWLASTAVDALCVFSPVDKNTAGWSMWKLVSCRCKPSILVCKRTVPACRVIRVFYLNPVIPRPFWGSY